MFEPIVGFSLSSNRHIPVGSNSQSNTPFDFLTLRVDFGQTQCDVSLLSHHCKQRLGNFVQLL